MKWRPAPSWSILPYKEAGWGVVDGSRVGREFQITQGRLQGAGKRTKKDIADCVLTYRGTKLPGLLKAKYYNINDGADALGGIPKIRDAFIGFQQHLYE